MLSSETRFLCPRDSAMSGSPIAFRSALQSFASSSLRFKVLRSIFGRDGQPHEPATHLYVLDSSFNPPTRAHLRMLSSALRARRDTQRSRVLLLLATQNADKAPKPASFEQRLEMMETLAQDLIDESDASHRHLAVDVGVTKLPYFVDKSNAILESPDYENGNSEEPPSQIHLVGYDTLVRILDTKYYPPDHTLEPLQGLFFRHGLRVTLRLDNDFGTRSEQETYIKKLKTKTDAPFAPGWEPSWGQKIEVDENEDAKEAVSSTRVRKAASNGDVKTLEVLCSPRVTEAILEFKPYLEAS